MCAHVGCGGKSQRLTKVSPRIVHTLFLSWGLSHSIKALSFLLDWLASELQGSSLCPPLPGAYPAPALGLQDHTTVGFYVVAGGGGSELKSSYGTASTLPTKLSPWSFVLCVCVYLNWWIAWNSVSDLICCLWVHTFKSKCLSWVISWKYRNDWFCFSEI